MNDAITFRAVDPGIPPVKDGLAGIIREKDYRHGRIRYLATDYGVGAMIARYGEYFEGEVAVMRRLVKPGDTVVSAGGNIGVHLIPLSKMVGESGMVYTSEPQEFIRENLLEPNLAMNGCRNVIVNPSALGEDFGTAHLPRIDYAAPNNFGGMEIREQGQVEVRVIPLDAVELAQCSLLMLDVEGYELAVLKGARSTIARCRPYLYFEIDREDKREPLLHYVHDELGYEVLYHTPLAFRPDNFAGEKENVYGNIGSIMCLAVPR